MERSDRIGGRRQRQVVDLKRAIGDGGDDERLVRFRPAEVVDAVGRVEGGALCDGGTELEDVDAAVAEYAEILGGGDCELVLVERAEFDGVAVERRLKHWHVVATPAAEMTVVDWIITSRGVTEESCSCGQLFDNTTTTNELLQFISLQFPPVRADSSRCAHTIYCDLAGIWIIKNILGHLGRNLDHKK